MCGRTARTVRREGTGNGAVTAMATGDGRPWETTGMSAGLQPMTTAAPVPYPTWSTLRVEPDSA